MRKLLTITLGPALPVLLAAVLTGCGGSDSDADTASSDRSSDRAITTAADRTTTTEAPTTTTAEAATANETEATEAPPPSTVTPAPASAPSTTTTAPAAAPTSTGRRYVCPEGGIDAVRQLQQSVDAGHQPWRLSAPDVAAACTYGVGASTVEPAGGNRYLVTENASGEQVLVSVAQPLGSGTVWAVTRITPA
jgi:hypothetical protein